MDLITTSTFKLKNFICQFGLQSYVVTMWPWRSTVGREQREKEDETDGRDEHPRLRPAVCPGSPVLADRHHRQSRGRAAGHPAASLEYPEDRGPRARPGPVPRVA